MKTYKFSWEIEIQAENYGDAIATIDDIFFNITRVGTIELDMQDLTTYSITRIEVPLS